MRFNSYEFIFLFLPITWLGWRLLAASGRRSLALGWLSLASVFFYGYWDWRYVPLLGASLLLNYILGKKVADGANWSRRGFLVAGLVWNIGLLAFFKYTNFVLDNVNALTGSGWAAIKLGFFLGISFITFQKIAFLVDAWRGKVKEVRFGDFALFVLFFPQLIAGPIVHHAEFIPQLQEKRLLQFDHRKTLLGGALFAVGLFQKAAVADTLAPLADSAFGLVAQGTRLRLFEAWTGVTAYSLQLFFDFAGYSHMALGLALLFGFRLPVNFLAPYTATSLIEFWRRWHMTLSAFLRDYVYIPLGGNRKGFPRQMTNLLATMTLAGLWHGAGWTFVLWGAFHGACLVINHLWRRRTGAPADDTSGGIGGHALTLLVVAFGWVLFRAADLKTALAYGESLLGLHGISVPVSWATWVESLAPVVRPRGLLPNVHATPTMIVVLLLAAWLAVRGPRVLTWLGVTADDVTSPQHLPGNSLSATGLELSYGKLALAGAAFAISVATLSRSSPFLYFQF
jgi:alginate O-acetyltransferase complex protein AlgI